MSTEARHAPVPPRPSTPPGTDPEPGTTARTGGTRGTGPGRADGTQPARAGHVSAGSAASRAAATPDTDLGDEPSVFAPRPPAGTSARD
ncbi:hypothetical protein ACLU3S_29145, partial [Streptomyces sp. AF1A]